MSKKRHRDENPESPDALKALFQRLAAGREQFDALEIWRTVVGDPWLQAEVARRAKSLASSHGLKKQAVEDIAQEVMLSLAAQLADDPGMGGKAELLNDTFDGWIGTILDHHCSKAARRMGDYRKQHAELRDVETAEDDSSYYDRWSDVADAVARLDAREQPVMLLVLQGLKPKEIAARLHMSYKQVRYAIEKALPKLKRWLAAYNDEQD